MALKRTVFVLGWFWLLTELVFKMASFSCNTSLQSLPEIQDCLVDWSLRQAVPDRLQDFLQFCTVSGFRCVLLISFQHRSPHMIVERIQIRRVWWPFIFLDKLWIALLNPFLGLARCMCWSPVLLKSLSCGLRAAGRLVDL